MLCYAGIQECVAEEETREKETPKKIHSEGLAEALADLIKLLEKFENMDPKTKRVLFIEGIFMVHYLLICKSMVEQGQNQANHRGLISEKDTSSRRTSDRSFGRCSRARRCRQRG